MEFNSHSNNLIMFLKLFIIFVPSFHEKCHDLGIQLIPHLTWKYFIFKNHRARFERLYI